jgi:pimeloyl-ACP methyl ester carboxylesterase
VLHGHRAVTNGTESWPPLLEKARATRALLLLLPLGDLVRLRRVESSDTRYAQSGDVHIAYRVFGAGPPELVFASGLDFPSVEFHEEFSGDDFGELTARMRVIRFDKRGTGASDRVSGVPSLEERMDDVRAVMDAAGVERAALLGHVDGAAMAILFAATYPDRVVALVLFQGKPRFVRAPDFPWAPTREAYEPRPSCGSRSCARTRS